jgi:hypothetical protein
VDAENLVQVQGDVSILRQSTTQPMFDTFLKSALQRWTMELHEEPYANYFMEQYGNGNWARFATGVSALDASSQTLEGFNFTISHLCGKNSSIDRLINRSIPAFIRASGERFKAIVDDGAFDRPSLLQTGVIPSEVLDDAIDLSDVKEPSKCRRFMCLNSSGAEISLEAAARSIHTTQVLFNRSIMSTQKGFLGRHRKQVKLEEGSKLPRNTDQLSPSDLSAEYHSLCRVTFTVANGGAIPECTCLSFAQRGMCAHAAAALGLTGQVHLGSLAESMSPDLTGRPRKTPFPRDIRSAVHGAVCGASFPLPAQPRTSFTAKVGLGAKAGAKRGSVGPSGRSHIVVSIVKLFTLSVAPWSKIFIGKVMSCRKLTGGEGLAWHVRYEDGDKEDFCEAELCQAQALHAAIITKASHLHEKKATGGGAVTSDGIVGVACVAGGAEDGDGSGDGGKSAGIGGTGGGNGGASSSSSSSSSDGGDDDEDQDEDEDDGGGGGGDEDGSSSDRGSVRSRGSSGDLGHWEVYDWQNSPLLAEDAGDSTATVRDEAAESKALHELRAIARAPTTPARPLDCADLCSGSTPAQAVETFETRKAECMEEMRGELNHRTLRDLQTELRAIQAELAVRVGQVSDGAVVDGGIALLNARRERIEGDGELPVRVYESSHLDLIYAVWLLFRQLSLPGRGLFRASCLQRRRH